MKRQNIMFHYHNVINHFGNHQLTIVYKFSYLKRRGIGGIDILRYSMGYCSSNGYANRIIIPSYDADGKLNYFIARDMFPNSKLKYKNPPMSKDTVCFEMFVNWNEPIVLCEGVFDAFRQKKRIPLLGKFPSKTLVTRLVEKVKQIMKVG